MELYGEQSEKSYVGSPFTDELLHLATIPGSFCLIKKNFDTDIILLYDEISEVCNERIQQHHYYQPFISNSINEDMEGVGEFYQSKTFWISTKAHWNNNNWQDEE